MQLVHERPDFEFFLRGADGRHALVNERTLRASFIVAPDALVEAWPASDASTLRPGDFEPIFALQPELIVLGCGDVQVFPPQETLGACLSRGIGLESMVNAAAARTYNVLAGEGRRVVAAFVIRE